MSPLVAAGLTNAAVASVLALVAWSIARAWRNPFVNRSVWLAVLLKFVVPPLVLLPLIVISAPQQTERTVVRTPPNKSNAPPSSIVAPTVRETPTPRADVAPPAEPVAAAAPVAVGDAPPRLPPAPAAQWSWRWAGPTLISVWIGGAVWISAVALVRIACFHIALNRARRAPEHLQRRADALAAEAGVKISPIVRLTDGRSPPLVWCIGRPATLLLPAKLLSRLTDAEMTAVLAHEITHVRRRDAWFRWFEFMIVSLYWWCPTAWWARRRVHEAEERCCDADALRTFPQIAGSYASALLATIDFVAPAPRVAFASTGFTHRGSLVRRFEMITSPRQPARPSRRSRTVLALAAAAILVVTPSAKSADPPPSPASQDPDIGAADLDAAAAMDALDAASIGVDPGDLKHYLQAVSGAIINNGKQKCTVELADGTIIEGEVAFIDGERIVVIQRDDAKDLDAPATGATPADDPGATTAHGEVWDLSLRECLRIALEHDEAVRLATAANDSDALVIASNPAAGLSHLDFQTRIENNVHDASNAYWELWLANQNVDALKVGRDAALATWRREKTLERAGAGRKRDEDACSSQYYFFRAQLESDLANALRLESRLRSLLGLATNDGRLIRPADAPPVKVISEDWAKLQIEALTSRVEIVRQQQLVSERAAEIEHVESLEDPRSKAQTRHAQMLLDRDRAILRDIELEIKHQVADALRDVDRNQALSQTYHNRVSAADRESEAVNALYEVGQMALDRVLDAQGRAVSATQADCRARADFARSVLQLHARTGTLLPHYNIQITTPPTAEAR